MTLDRDIKCKPIVLINVRSGLYMFSFLEDKMCLLIIKLTITEQNTASIT